MSNEFSIDLEHNGKQYSFPAQLIVQGYIYYIEVLIEDSVINFERDNEQNWRALAKPEDVASNKNITVELLRAVADSLEKVLN